MPMAPALRALAALSVAACAMLQAHAATLPDEVRTGVGRDWVIGGSGEARWLGFSLYRAALWSAPGGYRADAPFALALRYSRDFAGERLVDSSISEIARLGASATQLLGWRVGLEQAFPDVKAGEVIVGLYLPGEGAAFYHQGRLTARLADEDFARLFFAIWLDRRTRLPHLREALLSGATG